MKPQYKEIEAKFDKTIAALEYEYSSIRAGRANPVVLDKLSVDYYGAPTKINQLASISVQEARVLVIQPYDSSVLKEIEKFARKKIYIGLSAGACLACPSIEYLDKLDIVKSLS